VELDDFHLAPSHPLAAPPRALAPSHGDVGVDETERQIRSAVNLEHKQAAAVAALERAR